MASSNKSSCNIEEDLKQKKVNYDWLKKNNMDIAELVQMTRKNKPQSEDDSDGEWIEEVIEDDDAVEPLDDLALTNNNKKKTAASSSSSALQIPQFKTSITQSNKRPSKPGPIKATYTPPHFPPQSSKSSASYPEHKKKKKDIDGSKLLLLQSAEKKIMEASTAFADALQEGEAIVSLLEFMLQSTSDSNTSSSSWDGGNDDDDVEEVDPKDWETRQVLDKTVQQAQSLTDQLEQAKHKLMGTRPKGSSSSLSLLKKKRDSSPDSSSPSKEANIPAPRPNLSMQREPSFREPSLSKIEEAEADNSDDEETTPHTEKAIRQVPKNDVNDNDDLTKAKNEFLQFAKEGAALASKLEKTQSPTTPTKTVATSNGDLAKAKNEFLQFAKEGAALASKLEKTKSPTTPTKTVATSNDDLAKAKNEFLQFAKEGAALASKLEKTKSPTPTKQTKTIHNNNHTDELAKAKSEFMQFAKEGAVLASRMASTKAQEEEEEFIEEEVVVDDEEEEGASIEQAKKLFLEAAKQGASLVTALEARMESKKAKTKQHIQQQLSSSQDDQGDMSAAAAAAAAKQATQELEQADVQVAKAKDSFVEIAKQGTEIMAKLEGQANEPLQLGGSGDSFLEAAKEGANMVAHLEQTLDQLKTVGDESTSSSPPETEEDSELKKARAAFLTMAQEGADLVTRLEKKSAPPMTTTASSDSNAAQIANTKQSFLEATQKGTALVSLMESSIKRRQEVTEAKEGTQLIRKAELRDEKLELEKANAAFLEAAKKGSALVARLETTLLNQHSSTTSMESDEYTEKTLDDVMQDSAIMDFTKEGEKLTSLMEASLGHSKRCVLELEEMDLGGEKVGDEEKDRKTIAREAVVEEESALAKAKESFLAAANEGAALLALMESGKKHVAPNDEQNTTAGVSLQAEDNPSEEVGNKVQVKDAAVDKADASGESMEAGKAMDKDVANDGDAIEDQQSNEAGKTVEVVLKEEGKSTSKENDDIAEKEPTISMLPEEAKEEEETSPGGKPDLQFNDPDISASRSNASASGSGSGLGYSSDNESTIADPDKTPPESLSKDENSGTGSPESTGVQAAMEGSATIDEKKVETTEEDSTSNLLEAKQSFLAAAKEGAALISQLEKKLEHQREQRDNEAENEDDDVESEAGESGAGGEEFLSKAKASFLAAAKEGAALVSLMENQHKRKSQSSSEGRESSKKKTGVDRPSNDSLLNTSKGFLDAAHFLDMISGHSRKSLGGDTDSDVEGDDDEEEEVINDVEAAKKKFLRFAKEGASLVSKLENKFTKKSEDSKGDDLDVLAERGDDDDTDEIDSSARAEFLDATKAELLSSQKDMDKKLPLPTNSVTAAAAAASSTPPEIERTESDEVEC